MAVVIVAVVAAVAAPCNDLAWPERWPTTGPEQSLADRGLPSTSRENQPITCSPGRFARGFDCHGKYCDNVNIDCHLPGVAHGESSARVHR